MKWQNISNWERLLEISRGRISKLKQSCSWLLMKKGRSIKRGLKECQHCSSFPVFGGLLACPLLLAVEFSIWCVICRSSFLLLFFPSPLRSSSYWSCHRLQVCHTSWEEPELLLSLLSFPPFSKGFPTRLLPGFFCVSLCAREKPLNTKQKRRNVSTF